ncbi:carboxymuconolactone decarboxylase family protein [Glycomyces buryatensis]|uniref:Carboxymuconolactone decarboxylase family protein n=1 Tax=Glycomyces buryatensis TaxID=2570927 RepID=A0A4S8QDS1_9ACTN|nr:carboxymuconolactone decarboxylase family protein [Glycomyces buryatensis]THV42538.1 carboxymuconolactone decarboxylase family protein [Glycomyces buryatensis]
MKARMNNPALVLPDAQKAIHALNKVINSTETPESTLELVHLRTSQINGCAACVFGGVHKARKNGETDDRLHSVAVWRESPLFNESERAALALAEAVTRIADRPESVTDEVWEHAAKHFDEAQLSAILLMIGMTNLFNRLNVSTRLPAGQTW